MQFRMTIDLAGEDMLTLDDVITALQRNGGTVTGSTAILTAGESAQIFDGNDNKVGQWQVIDDVPGAGDEGPNGLEYAAMKRAEKEAFAADACAEYASRSGLTRGTRAVPSCGSRRFPRTGTNAVAGSRSADGDCFPSANAITMWANASRRCALDWRSGEANRAPRIEAEIIRSISAISATTARCSSAARSQESVRIGFLIGQIHVTRPISVPTEGRRAHWRLRAT
jgi:hypothetical protein